MKQFETGAMLIYDLLFDHYKEQHWWPAESAFEMMIGAILTQNTAWTNVERCIEALRDSLTPKQLWAMDPAALGERIRPSGYYNQKAKKIKFFLEWYQKYQFDEQKVQAVPTGVLREELLAIHGIGKETADSILLYAFGRERFVVDAYTRRLFQRLGFDSDFSYDSLADSLAQNVPAGCFNEYHALIVRHCKEHCRVKPSCEGCPLREECEVP